MRYLSLIGLSLILFITACTPSSTQSRYPDLSNQPKVKPYYETVYNCHDKKSCYSAATIRCRQYGGSKKPVNMSLHLARERAEIRGAIGGRRYRYSYTARFACK